MAETLSIGGYEFKKRSPLGVWGLTFITLSIYGFVWYYKVNKEAKQYLGDENIKPGVSVLALIPGFILIIPPFVSIYRTGERIDRMQEKAGVQQQVSPVLGILCYLVYSLHTAYYQSGLNKIWERYAAGAGAGQGGTAPGGAAQPPPPAGGFSG
ncbi:MAG: DUF4234 domain-containing protein [Actinomycetota bacterium]